MYNRGTRLIKHNMIDDCINRWGGIFWSKTGEFLEQTIINQDMGWTVRGLNTGGSKRFFSSSKCPDWLWGKPSLLCSGFFSSSNAARV
jgi:hypothetical protein